MKDLIKKIFLKLGLVLTAQYDFVRQQMYIKMLERFASVSTSSNSNSCSLVVFSKDRAMQLDALLRSYLHYVSNPLPVVVLYQNSNPEFKKGYQELIPIYNTKGVQFVEEKNFRLDLIALFNDLNSEKIIFLVDDIIFKNEIDFKSFTAIDPKKFVASLRMGKHLTYSYTLQEQQALPTFSSLLEFPNQLSWSYQSAEYDWAYPLSVDGHLFDFQEIKTLINELEYKAPNSFEEALQLMLPFYNQRKGLCFSNSIIVNNPCNKVQTENDNIAGKITIEELNTIWLGGSRINFEKEKGLLNESAHQELTIEFIKR